MKPARKPARDWSGAPGARYHAAVQWPAAAVAFSVLVAGAVACSGKATPTPPAANPIAPADAAGPTAAQRAACDRHAARVADLYRAQLDQPIDGEVEDATDMLMADCYRDADRLAPCLERATSIEQLEHDCVTALDDEGRAEQQLFGGR